MPYLIQNMREQNQTFSKIHDHLHEMGGKVEETKEIAQTATAIAVTGYAASPFPDTGFPADPNAAGFGWQVIIPNSVIFIKKSAFIECRELINVQIPNSAIDIGEMAFFDCLKLVKIVIPESVLMIGPNAFNHSRLNDLNIQRQIEDRMNVSQAINQGNDYLRNDVFT